LIQELRRASLEKGAQVVAVFRGGLLPIRADGIPSLAQTFRIGIAVLRDQRDHPFRTRRGKAVTDGRAVIKNVESVAREIESVGEAGDYLGEVIEGIAKGFGLGRIGEAEAWQVGSDDAVLVRKPIDEAPILMAGARKAMKKDYDRRISPASR